MTFILPRHFPAALIIFAGGAGNPPRGAHPLPAPSSEGGPHERHPTGAGEDQGGAEDEGRGGRARSSESIFLFSFVSLSLFDFSVWDVFVSLQLSIGLTKDRERSETVATNQHFLSIH